MSIRPQRTKSPGRIFKDTTTRTTTKRSLSTPGLFIQNGKLLMMSQSQIRIRRSFLSPLLIWLQMEKSTNLTKNSTGLLPRNLGLYQKRRKWRFLRQTLSKTLIYSTCIITHQPKMRERTYSTWPIHCYSLCVLFKNHFSHGTWD